MNKLVAGTPRSSSTRRPTSAACSPTRTWPLWEPSAKSCAARYGKNLAAGATATASSSLPENPTSAVLDGKYETYWEAAPRGDSDAPVVLEVTLPRDVTFTRVVLQEQIRRGQRVEAFTIEARQEDGQWRKIGAATTIGYKRVMAVPETTASHVRVRFDRFRVAPTLAELGLYY